MKLYRFMSIAECDKLLKGETLVNSTDHSKKRGTASTAKGFCFGIGDEEQAKKDFRRLKGIVDSEILFVFTLKPESESCFNTCQGRYVDYDQINFEGKTILDYPFEMEPHCMVVEYCANSYSLEDFEEYKFYGILFDINKDPSAKDSLKLRDLSNTSKEPTGDSDLNKSSKLSMEILGLFGKQDITAKQALLALGVTTSVVIDFAVKDTGKTYYEGIDDFTDLLKSLASSYNKKQ